MSTFGRFANGLRYGRPERVGSGAEINAAYEEFAQEFETSYKCAKETGNEEMTNCHANVEPRAFVTNHVEEVKGHHVRDGHYDHE